MIIPDRVTEILKQVQTIDKDAILVGGYLRDIYCNQEPKDLDIVVNWDTSPHRIFNACNGVLGTMNEEYIESSAQDINFSFEVSFEVENFEYPVNIIGARRDQTPVEKLKLHDFGLCQIWYDGEHLLTTAAYDYDVKHACFTLQRCNSQEEWNAVLTHYFRLQRKYPWPIRIPPHFMKLIYEGFRDNADDAILF